MTVLDEVYNFSDLQSVVLSSGGSNAASTDVVDQGSDMTDAFGTAIYDAAIGSQAKRPVVVVTIGTALTGASAALLVKIESKAASASISSGGTEHARVTFSALSAANTRKILPVPADGMNRYWGLTYAASGGNIGAGTVNAYLADAGERID
jgi:hypothetical protein